MAGSRSGESEYHHGQKMVYRYSAAKWNDQLVSEGRLRLGTLHGYRDEEALPPPIGDSGEGKKMVHANFDDSTRRGPGETQSGQP